MSRSGQRGVARWGVVILAGWLIVLSVQAQQSTSSRSSGSDDQGGFVVIEDAQSPPPPPPQPLALPVAATAAVVAPVAPQRQPLPTLPPNAIPVIERKPPIGAAQPAQAVTTTPARPAATLRPVTTFAVSEKKTEPSTESYTIPAGTLLSQGLSAYVSRYGWSMRWLVQDDYRLDAPLPIPAGSVTEGVTFVVHAYQTQGGLLGDVPRFAKPNKVVVIQPITAATESY